MFSDIEFKPASLSTFALSMLFPCILLNACTHQQAQTENQQQTAHQQDTTTHAKKDEFYSLPGLQHGLLQSPINILSSQSKQEKHNVTVNFKDKINKVQNLGHTVQLDFGADSTTLTIDGKTYMFKQVHFHTPAEHLIDGITYPMEMHVVNTLLDQAEQETTEYLVLAFLFKMGRKNTFIDEFIKLIPEHEDEEKALPVGTVNIKKLLVYSADTQAKTVPLSYFFYKGSLTTQPFTESVKWFVMKTIVEASPEQIQQMNKIEGDNARRIQSRYGRPVSQE